MLPKRRKQIAWTVVGINLVVLVIFAAALLSLPALTSQDSTPVSRLCCRALSSADALSDYYYGWQLYEESNGTITASWENLYQRYLREPGLLTVSTDLKIVRQGIVYCGDLATASGFRGWIKYRNQVITVVL